MITHTLSPAVHDRLRGSRRYVYAVRARRSGGISVGINVDPQRTCNFDCVYCEVIERRELPRVAGRPPIVAEDVARELEEELTRWPLPGPGADTVRDIAFAGDGEPSTFPGFLPLASRLLEVRDAMGFREVPLVLITNGSGIAREEMRAAHDLFAGCGGAFWIKLDAGTEGHFREVCRTEVPFARILANLAAAARRHAVVVQSMFLSSGGAAPGTKEIAAWAGRLRHVIIGGGRLSFVQVYTVAREPREPGVEPLTEEALEQIADVAREALPGVPVRVFP